MSRFGGPGFGRYGGKRPYPPREDLFERRGDFYPPPQRFPEHGPPLVDDFTGDNFGDLPPSPFLQRMMGNMMPSKKDILLDLGQSVVSSLKDGTKLSNNPLVREKLQTLIQVEHMDEDLPPPPVPPRGPYSRYDSYYEGGFAPPVPNPQPPVHMGFRGAQPNFPPGGPVDDWHTFLRVGKAIDRNRIYASERELATYFSKDHDRTLRMPEVVQTRLKNTFSFEISQTKFPKRRNWLIMHHTIISKSAEPLPPPGKRVKVEPGVTKKRTDSAWKKQKKRLRDKRPPQSETERRLVNYLKSLLFELCGQEEKEHAVLVLRAITTNPNMSKCLMTECNTFLDKQFGAEKDLVTTNKKRSFLINFHRKHMEETRKTLVQLGKAIQEPDEAIYSEIEEVLSGKKVDPEKFATPEDYVLEPGKSDEDFIVDFKYEFVRFAFEKFYFKVVESFCVTKDRRKRINFFMNNGFLAGLIWTSSQGKTLHLPGLALKYTTLMDKPCKETSSRVDERLLEKIQQKGTFVVKTNYEDFTASRTDLTPELLDKFKACIDLFDPKASIIKYQLVDYTPYNPLPRDYKLYVFNEIMKFVYLQCLENVMKDVNTITKAYVDMDKD